MADEIGMWGGIRMGDRVRLKSGGPVMLVEAIVSGDELLCFWIEGDQERKEQFSPNDLELVGRDPLSS